MSKMIFTKEWLIEKKVPAIQIIARMECYREAIAAYESGDSDQVEFVKLQLREYEKAVLVLN